MSDRYGKWSPEEARAQQEKNREAWTKRYLFYEQCILVAVKHYPGKLDELGLFGKISESTGLSFKIIARVVKMLLNQGVLRRSQYRDALNRSIAGLMLTDRAAEMLETMEKETN